jgi:hypothetical protein
MPGKISPERMYRSALSSALEALAEASQNAFEQARANTGAKPLLPTDLSFVWEAIARLTEVIGEAEHRS